ncbi:MULTISPECIES: PBECR4 domain-containing protein [Bacteria]|uniref:Phage-Barnase-EndoU-ColicinE5/D-RelE like nuclease 4 domain-containing protein n=1 Tax=Salmonella dublin TaxID=98360 RepID=F5BQS2_SALDU|nr:MULTISPECIES: PBECR4 domain-containing protein [Bacteria]AEA95702.1 hypothetical protein pSD853_7.9_9 [Salmonella enterica subsp. enterica serovar Dublin]MED3346598.1 PBECR4 domain-containing protein [Bacillus thuringiensis]MED3603545.1 PBECR4 domain-containing protein [Bacillus subtilis]MED3693883.1 PBECR4 domain-containing protein [Bacillus subtilis]
MLSVTDLLTLNTKPSLKDITLQTIQEFYSEHLCKKVFIFELDSPDFPLVRLRFEEDNFCHLLGIQHVLKSQKGGTSYIGQEGYNLIKKGTVTFDFMKTKNKQGFKSKKNRMLYFPFVYQVLNSPTITKFSRAHLTTNIDLDILFYTQTHNIYLHLGLGQDNTTDYFYPKTFYDRKRNDHIDGQEELTLKSMSIELDN